MEKVSSEKLSLSTSISADDTWGSNDFDKGQPVLLTFAISRKMSNQQSTAYELEYCESKKESKVIARVGKKSEQRKI